MKQLVVASSNPGKLREISEVLAPLGFEIIPQTQFGIADAEEPHVTFVENALAKARHASRLSGLPALADDSGICAVALNGEPGVYSARFAGGPPDADRAEQDKRNNQRLISLLSDKEDRRAHYACVMVLVRHAEDPEPVIGEGRWLGEVIDTPRGANGFGYDPYFYLTELGKTAAELDAEQKNALSHRGKALRLLIARLKEGG